MQSGPSKSIRYLCGLGDLEKIKAIHIAPMHPIPVKFDHSVHVVTFRVQIKTLFFTLVELKCF